MMGGGGGALWGMMAAGAVFWILILVGLGFLIWALFARAVKSRSDAPEAAEDPLAVARIRYARGEISRDEFLQIQQDLGKGGRS